jgi:hypothetical protein
MGDPDPESMTWLTAIRGLTHEAKALSPADYQGVIVNIAFRVDGTVLPLDFTGVRTGSYRKATRLLEVQAAVAKDPVPDRRGLLLDLVVAAVDEAEAYLIRRKVATGLPVLTAHVVVDDSCFNDGHAPQILDQLQVCVAGHFKPSVEHSTFQLEPAGHVERDAHA